ncbi:MAG: cysteine synthase family protein [Candidatus Omnitrophota bacterium]|nr:cysteine synthase family protein [Candidatus Omnitrophota bacterium]
MVRTLDPALGQDLLSRIGNTPLLRLRSIGREIPGVTLLAKAEWFNPGGSVKDRAAAGIVAAAEKAGKLTKEKILLDASSGNTAIAYAMIAASKGYKAKLCVPSNANPSVIRTLKSYGAEVVLTNPLESSDGAIREARRLAAAEPGKYFYADQYNNPANWQAHYGSTGPEIWEQTGGELTHLVAGLGTTGTLMGTGRFLKEKKPSLQVVAIQPDSPLHGLEGLKQMATSIVPGIYDEQFPDLQMEVKTEEAYGMVKRLAREEGWLAGISSGAALAASLKLAASVKNGIIVMIFPDGGARYLDEEFWKR